ncbi:hypothetical protein [Paracoccus litorisediminis]|uniref:Uncharacterized protein n=1 Tax=Paracoccus litorisediminis TaxID=2006130 RepID=A0A844HSP9_9RHOB|nr:hypothetical protein [Paracoccus litorisediminis]MTH62189.1 hypothetical protein [Paracoccus litorisediminis]
MKIRYTPAYSLNVYQSVRVRDMKWLIIINLSASIFLILQTIPPSIKYEISVKPMEFLYYLGNFDADEPWGALAADEDKDC